MDSQQTVKQDGLPIGEAAKRLNTTTQALRKRLQRGTLTGYKRQDGAWMVVLPEEPAPDTTPLHLDPVSLATVERAFQQTIDSLQSEVAFLRSELERKDFIVMRALAEPKALPAPVPQPGRLERWWAKVRRS